jgi:hypothetical protein
VGGEGFREVAGKLWVNDRDGAGRAIIGGGIDEDESGVVAEITQQVKATGAAVHQFGLRAQPRVFQVPDGVDADAFIAEQEIADAENQRTIWWRFQS